MESVAADFGRDTTVLQSAPFLETVQTAQAAVLAV